MYHEHECKCDHVEHLKCFDRPFKIEAIVVCRDYADFLANTLPFNKQLFDRIVVVTSPTDTATRKLCEYLHVQCVTCEALANPNGFFKGEAINEGLKHISQEDWVVQMDADIFLPPQTRILLERARLNKYMVYGIDRFNVPGPRAWQDFLRNPKLQHECEAYIHLHNSFPLGQRVMTYEDGYIPIGFFQLWNPKFSGVDRYPEQHNSAGKTDMQFAKLWTRNERGHIPEIVAYHLESDANIPMGANWYGRKTPPFVIPPSESIWRKIVKFFEVK
jgi:glycosyltransferase involved in cell wall biosynthesis